MDINKSLEIIHALANGIDPHTGEEYSADSPYQQPETIRALFMAMQALQRTKKTKDRLQSLPGNTGKVWESEEDQRLNLAFDAGRSITDIAVEHQRTELGIRARLVKHGKISL